MVDVTLRQNQSLPSNVLIYLLESLYLLCLESLEFSAFNHYCSLQNPCRPALDSFSCVYAFRLVCSDWNSSFISFRSGKDRRFFQQVEAVYYPHEWHINTKVRRSVLFGRYRVFRTIDTDNGERGVFEAFDFGSPSGCKNADVTIVKAWVNQEDSECRTERRVYETLKNHPTLRVPSLLANDYDDNCKVHALVLEKLGASLEDLLEIKPGKRLEPKEVLALAIQMLDRHASLHTLGIVHNGVKPGNICLPKVDSSNPRDLFLIDFGISFVLDGSLPIADILNTVGNRTFLSVFGHHGISQSQRDDLESLGYLLSFLHHGSLPWSPPTSPIPRSHLGKKILLPDIWRVKSSTSASTIFRGMDTCFLQFWKDVKSLAFGEKPNYKLLKSYFITSWETMGFGGVPGEIDWLRLFRDLKRDHEHEETRQEANFVA